MSKTHKVQPGDCLNSIANTHGVAVDKLWDHPDNAELRRQRRDANVLAPGDVVVVPERERWSVEVAAGNSYTFQLLGTHVDFRLRLELDGKTLANERYELAVGAQLEEGETDAQGLLETRVSATATRLSLRLPQRNASYELLLGHLDPVDQWLGASQRLHNLGLCEAAQSSATPSLQAALRLFQRRVSVEVSGQLDQATTAALREYHGS